MLSSLNFQPNQKVASVGVGGGLWEVMMGFENENVSFHLQEIDPQLLNVIELNQTIQYFEKQYGKPTTCNFSITIGTKFHTNLPTQYFDKVLLINSFHEFEQQQIMLLECKRILKPSGQLIIEEQLAQYSGELHEGCAKRLFLENEILEFFIKNGFLLYESHFFENKIKISFIKPLIKQQVPYIVEMTTVPG
jgi:ubiquinone/menaquinone biosynthesis C-methylase UbiE